MSSKPAQRSEPWRFSVILASTRDGTEVFDTLDEMPTVLRARCVEAVQSKEAATMLIADAAGRQYVQRVLDERREPRAEPVKPKSEIPVRVLTEIALCGAAGLIVWLVLTLR